MKFPHLTLAFTVFQLLSLSAVSQIVAPTTEAEYNYGAVGYKIQLQAKLDTREGYHLVDAEGCEDPERKIEFKIMYRTGEAKPCGVIMIYTRIRNSPLYYCIPTENASPLLWEKFHKSLHTGTDNPSDQLHFFSYCLARLTMQLASHSK